MDKNHSIPQSEWQVMELLWQQPRTLMQLVSELQKSIGWSKSTVTTLVRRMIEKELITFDTDGRTKIFRAAVSRDDVVARETDSLLHKAYRGSLGLMLCSMVQHNDLTKEDIDELYAILKQAEEDIK
jgi:BlaI family penicillinase repressor